MHKMSFLFAFLLLMAEGKAQTVAKDQTCEQLQQKCKEMSDAMEDATPEKCAASKEVCDKAQRACADVARNQPNKLEYLHSTTAHSSNIRKTCSQTTAGAE